MRYEFIEPFVSSTVGVLDRVVQCDVAKGNIALVNGREMTGDIVIMIGIEDHSPGSIIVNMDEETALNISNAMNNEASACLTSFGMDCIAELANMIAGNAVSRLNDGGFDFKVAPPKLISRCDITQETRGLEIFQVPLFTECGEITVNALIEEA